MEKEDVPPRYLMGISAVPPTDDGDDTRVLNDDGHPSTDDHSPEPDAAE